MIIEMAPFLDAKNKHEEIGRLINSKEITRPKEKKIFKLLNELSEYDDCILQYVGLSRKDIELMLDALEMDA